METDSGEEESVRKILNCAYNETYFLVQIWDDDVQRQLSAMIQNPQAFVKGQSPIQAALIKSEGLLRKSNQRYKLLSLSKMAYFMLPTCYEMKDPSSWYE